MICIISILDSSLKIIYQIDLKKLIAFCTIQEMNIILLNLFLGNNFNLNIIFLFTLIHTLLSSLFFFQVDIIFKRYNSRLVFNIKGLFKNNLNLSLNILFSLLIYNGFPISIKFLIELYFLINLFNNNFFFIFLVLNILNFFSILGFSKI